MSNIGVYLQTIKKRAHGNYRENNFNTHNLNLYVSSSRSMWALVKFVCLYQPDVSVDNFLSGFQIKDVFSWGSTEQVKRQSSSYIYTIYPQEKSPRCHDNHKLKI